MRKTCLAVASLILLSVYSPLARAEDEPLPQPIVFVSTFLQLSGEQTHGLITIIHTRDETIRPILESLRASHEALEKLLDSPDPDAATVGRLIIEIYAGQEKAQEVARQAAASFAETLNDEQRQKLQLIRQAEQVAPAIPAFKALGVL
jgi:uncharacterized membrane protein